MQAYVETPEMAERGLFLRGLRLVVSYIRMHPRPFLISVGGSLLFALASIGLTVGARAAPDNVLQARVHGGVASSKIWLAVAAIMAAGTLRAGWDHGPPVLQRRGGRARHGDAPHADRRPLPRSRRSSSTRRRRPAS